MSTKRESKYVIDAGNTRLKIAHFQLDKIQSIQFFNYSNLDLIKLYLSSINSQKSLFCSVLNDKMNDILIKTLQPNVILNSSTPLPIEIKYQTPISLGADRRANAVAIQQLNKSKSASLCIDIGTCVKFDFVDETGAYVGGSISPGIGLRFKSMNDYTGKLPLIKKYDFPQLIGQNTEDSLKSGVIQGMNHEINAMISSYEERFQGLTTFMTGGDAKRFDIHAKFDIFAVENLTLQGLNIILEYNA